MTFGCQKSLIMKAPYFCDLRVRFCLPTQKCEMCVLFDLNLPEDDNIIETSLCSADMMTNMYTPATATDCKVHKKKKRILKTMGTKQWSKPYSYREMLQSPSKLLLLLFPRPRVNFLQYVSALDACFSGLCTSHSASFRSFCCLALVLLLLWFKVEPGAFLKCIFRRAYIGIAKSQNVQN